MAKPKKIGEEEARIIRYLALHRGATHKEFMRDLSQDRGNLSRRLDQLERSGYIGSVGMQHYDRGKPGKMWGLTIAGLAYIFPGMVRLVDDVAESNSSLLPLIFGRWERIKAVEVRDHREWLTLDRIVTLFLWVAFQRVSMQLTRPAENPLLGRFAEDFRREPQPFEGYLLTCMVPNEEDQPFMDARPYNPQRSIYLTVFFGVGLQVKNTHLSHILEAFWEVAQDDDELIDFFRSEVHSLEERVDEDLAHVADLRKSLVFGRSS